MQRAADFDEDGIADHVAIGLVDLAKTVDVDENHRVVRARPRGGSDGRPELRAIEQAGENVVRLLVEDPLELPALLHVVGEERREDVDEDVILGAKRQRRNRGRCKR